MSKKNNLAKRKRQHEFELQKEKEERDKKAKKLQAKKSKMKIDGVDEKKKNSGGYQVGKRKVKTKLSALARPKQPKQWRLTDNIKKLHLEPVSLIWGYRYCFSRGTFCIEQKP